MKCNCKYKEMILEAEKYRKNNRDYQKECDDNKLLRILLGCQTIEMRNMRLEVEKYKKDLSKNYYIIPRTDPVEKWVEIITSTWTFSPVDEIKLKWRGFL